MITIYDLAEDAGVSAATVSRALNHPAQVSETTRERVLASARRLGYWTSGRKTARHTTGVTVVAVVGPFAGSARAQALLNGVLERARHLPVEVVAHDHESVRLTAKAVGRLPLAGRIDAVVIVDLPVTPSAVSALRVQRMPAVLLGAPHPDLPSVSIDAETATAIVADLLTGLDAASVLLVGVDPDAASGRHFLATDTQATRSAAARLRSVVAAIRERGAPLRLDAIVHEEEGPAETARAVATALVGRRLPVAVFAATDELATAVLRAAAQRGLVIPRDVAVLGFGDSAVAEALAISSVREPLAEAGRVALDHALALVFGQQVPTDTSLAPLMVARSTTPGGSEA